LQIRIQVALWRQLSSALPTRGAGERAHRLDRLIFALCDDGEVIAVAPEIDFCNADGMTSSIERERPALVDERSGR
jgi:hypothetical protein